MNTNFVYSKNLSKRQEQRSESSENIETPNDLMITVAVRTASECTEAIDDVTWSISLLIFFIIIISNESINKWKTLDLKSVIFYSLTKGAS